MATEILDRSNSKDFAEYAPQIVQRAEIALRCAPFTVKLLADMAIQGVNLRAIAGHEGLKNQYLTHQTNLIITENSLLWLIQVGILRREVDGQGITDSFRLTPMGHFLLDKWQTQPKFPIASFCDRLQNFWMQIQISRFL
ncbi:Npun_F0494 family protein [Pseudanabaena sp. 'Roaring Creek']|uniref:Npun_F0494 family protein n=1 Tax=Pseudanabaena sp. 'Roaring Creek' TaxID=1681830 RepID=UPI0006D82F02|nr:Npun_F0494 family protein [Pseudanabaena sp. 'Roaring Creek']